MFASLIITFIQFLSTHQSGDAIYCVFAMCLAGYLVNEAIHELRPRIKYAQQALPPINLIVSCMESNGKWSIEAKVLDWS